MDIRECSLKSEETWKDSYGFWNKIIKTNDLAVGAEIGVAYGGHAASILNNTPVQLLYCVDPYFHFPNYDDPINLSQPEFDAMYRFARERVAPFGSRGKLIRLTSIAAARRINDNSLDFVYLDANHTYEAVTEDLCAWFEKVKDGGILGGHDYGHVNFPGVKTAVDSFFARFGWSVKSAKNSVWWVEKKPIAISFVIPAYNCEKTIAESVNSILETNISPLDEVVIVNDCSTDNTAGVLNSLSRQNSQVTTYHHKVNRGGGATRNTGVMNSHNELIFCLDSDNVLQKKSVEKLKKYLVKSGGDNAAFEKITFFKKSTKFVSHTWRFDQGVYGLKEVLSSGKVPGASGNYLYTKRSWIKVGGYPEFAGALDTWGFGLRLAANGFTTTVLKDSSYYHGLADNSYWIRDFRSKNSSLVALQILIPYFNLLSERDIHYLFSKNGRSSWFDNLAKRPLSLKQPKNEPTMVASVKNYLSQLIKN